ncbi:MAG TPA: hypothetical protein PLS95_06150 [Thermoanaerobaculales bacterium]|nr:hypothetical protein [Thermoanaerobaculales bacterium]HQN97479.1 hypothetical protein [Thermoanaerobaculales bacterium]HQP44569.1 hypothetical protein [Thermoanaerobaculales bacterium]
MRKILMLVILLATTAAFAEEITVDKIINAYNFGATPEMILAKINDPANTLAPATPQDLARMRDAGVPESIVGAVAVAAPQAAPTPSPVLPDDGRLVMLVSAIKGGVSEAVLIEQINNAAERFALSIADLLYLKQNGVSEAIMGALQATNTGTASGTATGPAAKAATGTKAVKDVTIEGLVMTGSTFAHKDRQGTLAFTGDEIAWKDAKNSAENFTVKASAVERAWVECRPLPAGNFCYKIGFEIFKGKSYSFLDTGEPTGSNDNVLAVREALAVRFPNLVFEEKIKK